MLEISILRMDIGQAQALVADQPDIINLTPGI